MRARRRAGRVLVPALLLGLAAMLPAGTAHGIPTLWIFPSQDCNTTLQDCIDNAQSGDTVEIETDNVINEFATISKSLTLEVGQGFQPVIAMGGVVEGGAGALDVTISGVTFGNTLEVELFGASGHSVSLDHVKVLTGTGHDTDLMVLVYVAGSVSVTRSTFQGQGRRELVELVANQPTGLVTYRVVGDRITGHGDPTSGAGIFVSLGGSGPTVADIFNNSVWDVDRAGQGIDSSVAVDASGTGASVVNIVGNSLDMSATQGLFVSDNLSPGGHVVVDVYDNLFTNESQTGVRFDQANKRTDLIRMGHNDFFNNPGGNVLNGVSPGKGNLQLDPKYVNEPGGNLSLQAGSPVIDRGITCSPGGVENLDAAGHGRLAGPSVDMGAFERGATAPTGQAFVGTTENDVLTGTPGADILCGYGGNDVLHGAGGNDYFDGGGGNDQLFGGDGNDIIHGGPGADVLVGGTGSDGLLAGPGGDCLNSKDGVQGNDHLNGGPGTDRFHADPGDLLKSVENPVTSC